MLLLSRFVGLEWNANEAVRLAEVKTASASEAVNRLSDNVGTLEQQLTDAGAPRFGVAMGVPAGGDGGATPTHPSPVGQEAAVGREAQLVEAGGDGGGGGSPPLDDADGGIISSPTSLSQNNGLEAAARTVPLARKAEEGAKGGSSPREVRHDRNPHQEATAESTRDRPLSPSSRNSGDAESGDDLSASSPSGRSDGGVGDGGGGESGDSSASGASGPGRRSNRAPGRKFDIDGGGHGSSRSRGSSGGSGGGRRKSAGCRFSVEGCPTDRPRLDLPSEQDVSSLSSSRRKDDQEVLQQPSASSRLTPLRG